MILLPLLSLLLLLLVYSTRPLGVFLLLHLTFTFMFYADNKDNELQLAEERIKSEKIFSYRIYLYQLLITCPHLNCPSDPIVQMFIIITKSTAWVSHMQSRCETKDTFIFGTCLFPRDKPVKNFGLLSFLNLTLYVYGICIYKYMFMLRRLDKYDKQHFSSYK